MHCGNAALAVNATDGKRRFVVVRNRCAFAEKFWLECKRKVGRCTFAAVLLDNRAKLFLYSSRFDSRSEYDRMEAVFVAQRASDRLGDAEHRAEILTSARTGWRSDADEREVRAKYRTGRVLRYLNSTRGNGLLHQFLDSCLNDR